MHALNGCQWPLGTAGGYVGDTEKHQNDDPPLGQRQLPMRAIAQPAAYLTDRSHQRVEPELLEFSHVENLPALAKRWVRVG
jgi:hypothetical protein